MTFREALDKRIPRIRIAKWSNPNAYVRLPLMAEGMCGPWCELYDEIVQEKVLLIRPGRLERDNDDYEIYIGPASEWEQHPDAFARSYVEK